jgi:hypothetical protein
MLAGPTVASADPHDGYGEKCEERHNYKKVNTNTSARGKVTNTSTRRTNMDIRRNTTAARLFGRQRMATDANINKNTLMLESITLMKALISASHTGVVIAN